MERLSTNPEVHHGVSSKHDLPLELLADVLRSIKQGDRLRCCALVSKRWRQAANMATSSLEYFADRGRHPREGSMMNCLSTWLASTSYASMIQSIEVEGHVRVDWSRYGKGRAAPPSPPVLQMPVYELRQLQRLKLPRCQLKAIKTAATSEASSIFKTSGLVSLGALTALGRLELDATILDLSELSSCTGLQHLAFCNVLHEPAECMTAADPMRFGKNVPSELAQVLHHLQMLTYLDLSYMYSNNRRENEEQLISTIFSAFGHLQQLKELHVQLHFHESRAEHLANLPVSLRALQLDDMPELTMSTFPRLLELTQLQHLDLYSSWHVDPQLLSSHTQLTSLRLNGGPFNSSTAVSELLTALQMLQRLKFLELPDSLEAGSTFPHLYAALVASSQLERLDLANCYIPQEAVQHILPQHRTLTSLSCLITSPSLLLAHKGCERMVVCCPALQELCITDDSDWQGVMLNHVQDFAAVSGLTALTNLRIIDNEMSDEELKNIGTCKQLKHLELQIVPGCQTDIVLNGLMHLSNLTRLTHLEVSAPEDNSSNDPDRPGTRCIICPSAAETSEDLHLQLQEAKRRLLNG